MTDCGYTSLFTERLFSWEMWIVYLAIVLLDVLFIVVSAFGINSTWYKNLRKDLIDPYIIGIIWVIVVVISYGSVIFMWRSSGGKTPNDLKFGAMFLLITLINLLFGVLLFNFQNLAGAFWVALIVFIMLFNLTTNIWTKRILSGWFMLPYLILQGYIVYSLLHTITLNGIII